MSLRDLLKEVPGLLVLVGLIGIVWCLLFAMQEAAGSAERGTRNAEMREVAGSAVELPRWPGSAPERGLWPR